MKLSPGRPPFWGITSDKPEVGPILEHGERDKEVRGQSRVGKESDRKSYLVGTVHRVMWPVETGERSH